MSLWLGFNVVAGVCGEICVRIAIATLAKDVAWDFPLAMLRFPLAVQGSPGDTSPIDQGHHSGDNVHHAVVSPRGGHNHKEVRRPLYCWVRGQLLGCGVRDSGVRSAVGIRHFGDYGLQTVRPICSYFLVAQYFYGPPAPCQGELH